MAAEFDLEVQQMGICTAFLHGELEETLYMDQPEGYIDKKWVKKVCKLLKTVYGLKQSPRTWYKRIMKYLKKLGFLQSPADSNVFLLVDGSLFVILALYVDDCVLLSNITEQLENVKAMLCQEFEMTDQGDLQFCLGIQILRHQAVETITLHQTKYLKEILKRFNLLDSRPVATPSAVGERVTTEQSPQTKLELEDTSAVPYAEVVGCLIFLANWTRPDISYSISMVSQFLKQPGRAHWAAVKRIYRYLKGTLSYGLQYTASGNQRLELTSYADDDWAADADTRKSLSAYCFLLSSGAMSWSCKKQASLALSSTEAKYKALTDACKEAEWERQFLESVQQKQKGPTRLNCDNMSAIVLVANPRFHACTKHIELYHHYIRDVAERGAVKVEYASTHENTADIFTKCLSKAKHFQHLSALGLREFVYQK